MERAPGAKGDPISDPEGYRTMLFAQAGDDDPSEPGRYG